MDDLTKLLAECERAIATARDVAPMTVRSEEVWKDLHKRVRAALNMPWTEEAENASAYLVPIG